MVVPWAPPACHVTRFRRFGFVLGLTQRGRRLPLQLQEEGFQR